MTFDILDLSHCLHNGLTCMTQKIVHFFSSGRKRIYFTFNHILFLQFLFK